MVKRRSVSNVALAGHDFARPGSRAHRDIVARAGAMSVEQARPDRDTRVDHHPAVAGARSAIPRPKAPARALDAWWVALAARAALVVFPALILMGLLAPHSAGRVFWTVAVAGLPLFFVLAGYHRWRRICPLAFVAQLPTRLGHAGQRRAGPWLQAHAYHVAFAVFVACVWLRLVATNGDGFALAAFLLALALTSVVVGLVFTGKTWCNYVCPVSFVEKLYTEPRGLDDTPNSQCSACTACKPACPDINEENSYWKEILSPGKRDAYFAFPGVVLAFYGYYYLQAGTWSYYFGGSWTDQMGLFRTAFLAGRDPATAGFWFWPALPRAAAAAVTLIAGATVSLTGFRLLEPPLGRLLERRGRANDPATLRSLTYTVAAFGAFVTFYMFAGAPTLRLVTGLPRTFQVLVLVTATLLLVRRIGRKQSAFAEETLARKIIANWKWDDIPAPHDLREAFLIHTIRSQSHDDARQRMLELYKTAVRDSVESGVVSRSDVHRLDALRSQLHIADTDHERVMAELADERGGLAASHALPTSPEKQLQLETYAEALAVHLRRQEASGRGSDDRLVRELRDRYGVTAEEHAAAVERLMEHREGATGHLGDLPAAIEWSAATVERLEPVRSPVARFLVRLLRRRWERAAASLARVMGGDGKAAEALRGGLLSTDAEGRDATLAVLGVQVSAATARRLGEAVDRARARLGNGAGLADALRLQLASPDPYLRATAFYLLETMDQATSGDFELMEADEHPIARETVAAARATADGVVADTSTLEKMIGLRSIGIFDDLEPEDLAQLARAGTEVWYRAGETLCQEGERGDEVFVLLDGEVSMVHATGPAERVLAVEGPGSCIGELAVLDPAPREASVVASTVAVRVLRLTGGAFRQALAASPAVSEAVIRILARRLRRALPGSAGTGDWRAS
jgi:Cyclic nucleotide-binding domain